MIISPWGEVLARGGAQEECVIGQVDPKEMAKARRQIPSLRNIRDDIYQLNSERIAVFRE